MKKASCAGVISHPTASTPEPKEFSQLSSNSTRLRLNEGPSKMETTTTARHSRRARRTLLDPAGKQAETYEPPKLLVPVDPSWDHIQGDPKAILTLVEYGDYQCPFCGAAYHEVKKAQKELGSKLRFVFRNFPLTNIHEFAMTAAETAEAAGAQGKFWKMHDFLYEHQATLGDNSVGLGYAKRLGLDTQRFEREIAQHVQEKRIK